VFEDLPTFTISHAVDIPRFSYLQLEVQRPKHFGGVRIGLLEPSGARIALSQDVENLLARPNNRFTPFAQGRQLQHNTVVVVWNTL